MEQGEPTEDNENSLEGSSTVVESSGNNLAPASPTENTSVEPANSQPETVATPPSSPEIRPKHQLTDFFRHLNIFLLAFVFIFIIAIVIAIVAITKSHNTTSTSTPSTSALTQSQLEKIANSSNTTLVGSANQVLNIATSTIFGGQVLVRQDLDVAGSIKIGGSLELPAITVLGLGAFQTLQTSKLTVTGDSILQGNVDISQDLAVAGATTFSGTVSADQLTVQSLQLNGDIVVNHHIDTGGATPTRTDGSALGYGGTVSVNGSDTAGAITIGTGSSPSSGCFVTITFGKAFNNVPDVVITPVGAAASGIAYYVTRSATAFSVCTTSTPPAGQSFGFDYIAID
jgi:cytoskeletal protein CcmA (bactofilin family)